VEHTVTEPTIFAGVETVLETVTARHDGDEVPHPLVTVTQIFPELPPDVTVSEVEFCPAVIDHPEGTVQL
jgi:hypothetical protein